MLYINKFEFWRHINWDTASRSVQPFCRAHDRDTSDRQTERQTTLLLL